MTKQQKDRPMHNDTNHGFEPEQIRNQIRALLTEPEAAFSDEDNLIELGLDSLSLMRLVGQWRKAGVKVSFAELIESPRLAHWWSLLADSKAVVADDAPAHAQSERYDVTAPFSLTDVQHAYWIGRNDEQVLGGVGCHAYLELSGRNIDPQRLEKAWQRLLAHHGMLRARFDSVGMQSIGNEPAAGVCKLHIYDLRHHAPESANEKLLALRHKLSHRRLSVEQGEVAGLSLSLLPNDATRLHFDVDLLVADVQSLQIILHDLAILYNHDEAPRAPIGWHFGRHLHDNRQTQAQALSDAQAYWQARLPTLPGAPGLPLRCAPETIGCPHFSRRQHQIPAHDWLQIKRFAAAMRVTPAMVLATAYAETLAVWSSTPAFLLNVPLFDRHGDTAGLDDVVADFTNLLLLAVDCGQTMSFADRARTLQTQFHADVAHSAWSGVKVQRELAQLRSGERTFAPVVFACNLGMPLVDKDTRNALGDLQYMISQTPQVWLDHQVYDKDDGVLLAWDAVDGLFPEGMIESMFNAYLHLLQQLADSEQAWTVPLPVRLPPEQQAMREAVNATEAPLAPRTLHLPVFEQAVVRPAYPALIDNTSSQTLDYAALARRALQVCALLQQHSVQPGEPVAVTLPRGIDQVVAVLGVLAAGACYVPIGIAQPPARQERIHSRAGIRLTLSQPSKTVSFDIAPEMRSETAATALDIAQAASLAPAVAPVTVPPSAPAYIIFTSGSTGEPKGVEISHQAAANTLDDLNRRFCVGPDDRILALSALDFDLSVYDLFGLLGAGATVVLPAEDERRDAAAWLELVHRHQITLWNSVPVLLDMLLVAAQGDARPLPLRLAMASGDWIGLDLPARLARLAPRARFIAMGGATEAAIWSNLCEVPVPVPPEWRSIPYGLPLTNQQYRVVDALGRDCPDWVAGELWIGGAGVANGYRGDPQRSAAAFVTHNGRRWYRTGDLGRYWPDGTLEFLGRQDHQIKLRGHRIELGEIEAALLACDGLRQAVAMVVGQPPTLAAAIVADQPVQAETLSAQLRTLLPDYMVPTQWLQLDTLPLSANGKIDRKALAAQLDSMDALSQYEAPQEGLEKMLAQIWAEVLGCDRISRHDDFFMLGGDSLRATRLIEAMRQRRVANTNLSLRQVFSTSTIAAQAAWLQAHNHLVQSTHQDPAFEEGIL